MNKNKDSLSKTNVGINTEETNILNVRSWKKPSITLLIDSEGIEGKIPSASETNANSFGPS